MPDFHYQDPFPLSKETTKYRKIEGSEKYVSIVKFDGKDILKIEPEAMTLLANQAMRDVSFMLRPDHNEQVAKILKDPESSQNDRGVAMAFLRNAEISANFELPLCQDTGTATIVAKKGNRSGPASTMPSCCLKGFTIPTPRRTCVTARPSHSTCMPRKIPEPTSLPRSTSWRPKGTPTNSSLWPKGRLRQ